MIELMAEPARKPPGEPRAEIVYRRTPVDSAEIAARQPIRVRVREIAPALIPLAIGFLLLLVLIFLIGVRSAQIMSDVSSAASERVAHHSALMNRLLQLRLALTKIDNEARIRSDAQSRREIAPPFAVRLDSARAEVVNLVAELNKAPLSSTTEWTDFRTQLESYIQITREEREYNQKGFEAFRKVNVSFTKLFDLVQGHRATIFQEIEAVEMDARQAIRRWNLIALLLGAFVAVGTVWEVQRHFKQMRHSMFESRRERAFTNQLLEGMVSAIAAIDEDDRIRSANAAFFRIFPGASIGASVLEKFAPDDAMKMLEAATSTRVTRGTYRGRWVAGVDSEEKTFDVYSSPLAIDGDRGQIVTLVDATEVAESERTLRRNESLAAVGQATTQVAHEIRNPLGSIRLGVSMLRDSVSDPEALNTIELVERGIKHLNKLVVDVTQFSRQKALERSRVDLHDSIERSVDLTRERIREKQATVERRFTEQPIIGHWDADQLRQVLVNVIANAIDASPEHAVVSISTEVLEVDGDGESPRKRSARIVIADSGKGMDEVTRDRIFEPFFSTKKRGTGLGLAIVKQIVELHGGRISVASEPEKGSKFTIDLPV